MTWLKKIIPTKIYIQIQYYHHFKKFIDFRKPITLNEKLQWLKTNKKQERYTELADKVQVKKFIKEKIGSDYVIPTLAVWDDADKIDPDVLPEKFVLKCNHDSHCVFICEDKKKFDFDNAKNILKKRLKYNGYWYAREYPYKNIKPQIMAETLLENSDGSEIVDYKILCFNGKPENIMVCRGRQKGKPKFYFFNTDWSFLPYQDGADKSAGELNKMKPHNLDLMLSIATRLSEGITVSRIDLYEVNKKVYFGEITFFPSAGCDTEITPEADFEMGRKIKL